MFKIPKFGKAKVQNSNVWKSQSSDLQSLEKLKFKMPMFGNAKIFYSNEWKNENQEFFFYSRHLLL